MLLVCKFNEVIDYGKSMVQMKVFIMECIGLLVMVFMFELQVMNLNIVVMCFGDLLFYFCCDEMVMLDVFKIVYLYLVDQVYFDCFYVLCYDLLWCCDFEYWQDCLVSFF